MNPAETGLMTDGADQVACPLEPDLEVAQRFLDVLSEGEPVTFQTFDDRRSDRSLAHILHGTLGQHGEDLAALNRRGAGVFVMVNYGDLNGRSAENVTAIRAAFVDLDGPPIEPVQSCGLPPHLIVESSPGHYQAHWLLADCALDEFKPLQKALAQKFGGDLAVNDLSRVMRLAGFLHQKGEPYRSRLISNEPLLLPYPVADLRALLPAPADKPRPRSKYGTVRDVPRGQRNVTLMSLAGAMRRRGVSQETIEAACRTENAQWTDPLDETEVCSVAASVARYAPAVEPTITPAHFCAYMPMHKYLFIPSRELWPAASVNSRLRPIWDGADEPSACIRTRPQTRSWQRAGARASWACACTTCGRTSAACSSAGWTWRGCGRCRGTSRAPSFATSGRATVEELAAEGNGAEHHPRISITTLPAVRCFP